MEAESTNEVMTHLTTGAVVVYAIQWLKSQGWCTWITAETGTLNRIISGVAAALIAFGVTWTGDAQSGWTIQIPMLTVLLAGVWEWLKQFTVQQVLFDSLMKDRAVTVHVSNPPESRN